MFKKVIVAEDLDSINIAVVQALEALEIQEIENAKYCDEAFLKIKKAALEQQPFELLITDLSFKTDHRESKLKSGEELIAALKKEHPNLKVIVFSIEDKSYRIRSLIDTLGVDGYVMKGRNSIPELQKIIEIVYRNEDKPLSSELAHQLSGKRLLEIEAYDIQLLGALASGLTQDEIAQTFKKDAIIPNGTSSIEKRINKLKIYFKANNNVHLIALAKDIGLI
jgi:DNA-binding NarL/FixJ family response regulator